MLVGTILAPHGMLSEYQHMASPAIPRSGENRSGEKIGAHGPFTATSTSTRSETAYFELASFWKKRIAASVRDRT